MQLKKLEMCGFKSFANRTEIAFEPGITGIVGPNGCGKSNVVDAIKWVLGTLSYKSVRGEEMIDVIFKGAEGIGPAGMAEVSLTLDNSDRALPIDFEEVTITRKLHATGEGEYFINGSLCRLKDIRDLLYGTGIGADNYSIIEQGKIDRLVTSDPRQRRLVFDEAAGISKYRARKKETENRLDKVTQDLLRLNDIVREVQRELRSVRSQAGRAARYRELQAAHRDRRVRLLLHEARTLRDRGREAVERLTLLENDKTARDAEIAGLRGDLGRLDAEQVALADRHAALTSDLSAASSRAAYFEQALDSARQRLDDLEEGRGRAQQDSASAQAMLADKESHLAEATREREAILAELAALESRTGEARSAVEDASRACREASETLETRKAEALERAQRESRYRNELTQVKSEGVALAARAAKAAEAERLVTAELGELQGRRAEATAQRAALESEVAGLKRALESNDTEQAGLKQSLARLDDELIRLRAAKERGESRRETLRELQVALEGIGEGARRLLRERLPGLCGTVADLLEAGPEDVAAVEAVLGGNAEAVLFETREQVFEALRFLQVHNLPRTTVLSLDQCAEWSAAAGPAPAILDRLSNRVRTEDRFRPVAQTLLGEAFLVENEEEAEGLRSFAATSWLYVTRGGDVYDPRGLTSAGPRGAGLLSRKAELKVLEQEIGKYLGLIERMEGERASAAERLAALEKEQAGRRHAIYDQSIALGEVVSQLDQQETRIATLESEREHQEAEQRRAASEESARSDRARRLDELVVEISELKDRIENEIRSLGGTLKGYEEARERLQGDLTRLQVERAKAEERHQSTEGRLEMIRAQMEQHREAIRRAGEALAQIDARLDAARQDLDRQATERATVLREIEEKTKAVEEALAARQEAQARTASARESLAAVEQASAAAGVELQALRVQEAQRAANVENLASRARDEFQIEIAEALEAPSPEGDASADWAAIAREADDLRAKIAGFGVVNTAALDQIGELEERERTLLGQQKDVEGAKRQLEDLIRRINRESKELFERTLEYVREQFASIFRKVFGGGKADIILQEEEGVDPFDQGLEVMVRIPQRELMPISSLSGGQKSLTAFSLVMALFKANPSPFCVLDEADAALDESNVDKYAALVNEFVHETQFIVITHNKRTMACADVLYGVTMETPGVSSKVSVDLNGTEGLEALKRRRE
ncbi:MAG TPA: chromosome segregation protein SMC, partial [Planctomycetota bacterium]|nr:chromosome segregation protein SMC [Planctomycetota bacterium]